MYRNEGVCIKLFSIFCKDDSDMLKLSKKLSIFSMIYVLQRNVTAANSPAQNYIGKNYGKQKGLGGPPA